MTGRLYLTAFSDLPLSVLVLLCSVLLSSAWEWMEVWRMCETLLVAATGTCTVAFVAKAALLPGHTAENPHTLTRPRPRPSPADTLSQTAAQWRCLHLGVTSCSWLHMCA